VAGSLSVRQVRSPFTVEQPPGRLPPPGVLVVTGWELAAWVWQRHLPHPLADPERCAACGLRMPCPGWLFADAFLADALRPQPEAAEPPRVLPHVKPPLPRRQPGAAIETQTRFDGWLTPSQ